MAEASKKNNDLKKEIDKSAKLFDVAKPGKTPASTTSRPVIVGHSPMIKRDPMVKEEGSQAAVEGPAPEAPEEKLAPHVARKIVPLSGSPDEEDKDAPENEEAKNEELKPAEPAAESEPPAAAEESDKETEPDTPEESPEPEKPSEPEEEKSEEEPETPAVEDSTGGAAVEALAGEVSAKREEQKQKEELAAKKAEVEETIAKKEFFVPIGQESRKRLNNHILFGLIVIILLTMAALNFAVDAELLDIGIKPLTDIM